METAIYGLGFRVRGLGFRALGSSRGGPQKSKFRYQKIPACTSFSICSFI